MTIVMISYHLSDFQMEIRSISGVSSREMSDNRRVNGFPGYTCGTGEHFILTLNVLGNQLIRELFISQKTFIYHFNGLFLSFPEMCDILLSD